MEQIVSIITHAIAFAVIAWMALVFVRAGKAHTPEGK